MAPAQPNLHQPAANKQIASASTVPSAANSPTQQALSGLQELLASEERIRAATDEIELTHLIVNETRRLTGAQQVFLLRQEASSRHRIIAVSSLALVDRDTPLIRAIEKLIRNLAKDSGLSTPSDFTLTAYADPQDQELKTYPFTELVWPVSYTHLTLPTILLV